MAIPVPAWLRRNRIRRRDPFTRAARGDLDIIMVPPYDVSETLRVEARAEVESLVARLLPNAVDAYSGEALHNLVNARADQLVARLDAERDDRKAIGEALIGIAKQEVAKRKDRYDADVVLVQYARQALDLAFQELTGRTQVGPFVRLPDRPDDRGVGSTFAGVDVSPEWKSREATDPPTDADGSSTVGPPLSTVGVIDLRLDGRPVVASRNGKDPATTSSDDRSPEEEA